jgi:hypothetical protein
MNDFNKSQSQNIVGMFSKSLIIDNILAMVPLNQNISFPTTNFNFCFNNGSDYIEKKPNEEDNPIGLFTTGKHWLCPKKETSRSKQRTTKNRKHENA